MGVSVTGVYTTPYETTALAHLSVYSQPEGQQVQTSPAQIATT